MGYQTPKINAIKVVIKKKNKNKGKDLSYIKYYIYKQKYHHANKCPKILKN